MRSLNLLPILAAVALAAPRPQDIDIDLVEDAADPVIITPAMDVASQTASVAAASVQASMAAAAVSSAPAVGGSSSSRKRDLAARDGPVASSDTPAAFLSNPAPWALSLNAATPYGYSQVFSNLTASLSASVYMGLYTLSSYDVPRCQSLCDQNAGCVAFNIYAERDPTLDPNASRCPNPPSTTNLKCTLWGAPVTATQANNFGQWRDSFNVVIAASNAYNKNTAPGAISGYTGPTELGGAINAPLDSNGHNTFMDSKFFAFSQTQGFTMQSCTSACTAQTAYNQAHPNKDGTFMSCKYVNGYVLSKNGIPQGLYCSMYNQTWDRSYATNYGQYRGSDRYTVSYSYSYTVNSRPVCTSLPPRYPGGPLYLEFDDDFSGSCNRASSIGPAAQTILAVHQVLPNTPICAQLCMNTDGCYSFSMDSSPHTTCTLYSVPTSNYVNPDYGYDGNYYYDDGCYTCTTSPQSACAQLLDSPPAGSSCGQYSITDDAAGSVSYDYEDNSGGTPNNCARICMRDLSCLSWSSQQDSCFLYSQNASQISVANDGVLNSSGDQDNVLYDLQCWESADGGSGARCGQQR